MASRSIAIPIDTGRLRRVVELVADKGGWGRSVPKGHGLGIAVHRSFVSYIATIVEVSVDDKGKLTVPRVDTAIDCGTFVNPERIQSQLEGAAIMGLSLAKYGEISFKDGKVQQGNFDDFPVIRIDEAPLVTNVHIVPVSADTPPSGVGEPGVPPFAPALVNAIFAATGKRIRSLADRQAARSLKKSARNNERAADIPSAAFPRSWFRWLSADHFLTANTQTTPPCGTLFSTPTLFLVANASWMRCASTPQPDWTAMYSVPST